jgi:radical SAM protein with 4Fe4S-binding SPASM domain
MCHAWPKGREIGRKQELSTEEIISAAKQISETYGVSIFRFMGGEPLVRKDLVDIVRGVSPFAKTLVTTNGMLLNERTCRALIDAGLSEITVSVDGPRENCDAVRGKGVYDKAVAGLKTMIRVRREMGSKISVRLVNVVSRVNLHRLEEAVTFAHELGIDYDFWPMAHFYDAAMATSWNGISCGFEHSNPAQASRLVLDDTELKLFWKEYYKLLRRFGARKLLKGWAGSLLKQIAIQPAFAPFVFSSCQRIRKIMIIGPSGEIVPCEYLRSISLGNVRDQNQERWQTPTRLALEKEVRKRSLPVCQQCRRLGTYVRGSGA